MDNLNEKLKNDDFLKFVKLFESKDPIYCFVGISACRGLSKENPSKKEIDDNNHKNKTNTEFLERQIDAAEFSFFLAVPTMFGATVYKLYKLFKEGGSELIMNNLDTLIIGNVVAFVVALLAIKFFISFVQKYGFQAFGWYRIIVGGLILVMLMMGQELTIS